MYHHPRRRTKRLMKTASPSPAWISHGSVMSPFLCVHHAAGTLFVTLIQECSTLPTQATKIKWKDDSKNLTKLYPREKDEDDDIPADPGSFFNYFEHEEDSFETGMVIANEIFPEAIEYFLGTAEGQEDDSEDEDSEDDDAEEIDLEKPRTKKRKV